MQDQSQASLGTRLACPRHRGNPITQLGGFVQTRSKSSHPLVHFTLQGHLPLFRPPKKNGPPRQSDAHVEEV